MKLKAGDKVRYLNATGGGIVSRIIDSRMVMITDEHGFEMPTLISELVKIDDHEPAGKFFRESGNPDPSQKPGKDKGIPSESHKEYLSDKQGNDDVFPDDSDGITEMTDQYPLDKKLIRQRKEEEVLLLFVPHDQQWMITGLMDVFLVNNSTYDVLYNIIYRADIDRFQGIDYGSVFANTQQLLATVEREDLAQWTQGTIQLIFHRESMRWPIPPFNADFRVDPKKFHKEGAYRPTLFHSDKALIVRILSLTAIEQKNKIEETGKSSPTNEEPRQPEPEKPLIFKYQTEPKQAVIDLHIHELLDDTNGMKSGEILDYQKQFCQRCLDSAMEHHFQKLIFIHGVGNGVLREAIKGLLRNIEGIEYFDAPMDLYGVGAVEVRIRHNR
jgi:hypothetical protein